MKPTVYLETTIVSYLTAWHSRDLIRAAHQEITRLWWDSRGGYNLHISQVVLDEAGAGDAAAAAERLEALAGLPLLEQTDEAVLLARDLVRGAALPSKAAIDALHIAIAAVNGTRYLLTWNCTHIANAAMRGKIGEVCRPAGFSLRPSALRSNLWRSRAMKYSDPIVDEVRAVRDAIAKEFNYDIERIARAIKERELASGREVVRLPPRKPLIRKAS